MYRLSRNVGNLWTSKRAVQVLLYLSWRIKKKLGQAAWEFNWMFRLTAIIKCNTAMFKAVIARLKLTKILIIWYWAQHSLLFRLLEKVVMYDKRTLLQPTVYCYSLQYTATAYSILLQPTVYCYNLQYISTTYSILLQPTVYCYSLQYTAAAYSILLQLAVYCYSL